jgi:hypothetical protein
LRQAQHDGGSIEFAAHADPGGGGKPYLKQAWGAFGAAYESQLREVGVLGDAETLGGLHHHYARV